MATHQQPQPPRPWPLHPTDRSVARAGVWTDIEDTQTRGGMTFIETLREATDIAHSAGLRFAVDAQVGWAFENISTAASRPTHMAVMDIVDEVTMMDYFSGCVDPLSTEGMPCHITQAMFFLAPFLTYANFLQRMHNRTVLLDVGLGVACETRLLARFARASAICT